MKNEFTFTFSIVIKLSFDIKNNHITEYYTFPSTSQNLVCRSKRKILYLTQIPVNLHILERNHTSGMLSNDECILIKHVLMTVLTIQ